MKVRAKFGKKTLKSFLIMVPEHDIIFFLAKSLLETQFFITNPINNPRAFVFLPISGKPGN